MKRWPFLDGWVLIALDLLAIGLWWFRDLGGMGIPVLVLCGLTAAWLGLRAWAARPSTACSCRGPGWS